MRRHRDGSKNRTAKNKSKSKRLHVNGEPVTRSRSTPSPTSILEEIALSKALREVVVDLEKCRDLHASQLSGSIERLRNIGEIASQAAEKPAEKPSYVT